MGNMVADDVGSAEGSDKILIIGEGRMGEGCRKNKSSKVLRTDWWRGNSVGMEKGYIEFSDDCSAIG